MPLIFNMLPRFIIAFLPRSKHLLIHDYSHTHSDFGGQEKKYLNTFTFSPSICHKVMGPDAMILVFLMMHFKPAFSLSSFSLIFLNTQH